MGGTMPFILALMDFPRALSAIAEDAKTGGPAPTLTEWCRAGA